MLIFSRWIQKQKGAEMTLTNLTERYKELGSPTMFERVKMSFQLECYYASSFYDIEDGFRDTPPKKKDRWSGDISAYVLMYNLSLKESEHSAISIDRREDLKLIDKGDDFPLMALHDGMSYRLAYWIAGNSSDYMYDVERYHIGTEFSKMSRMILQYFHGDGHGWLGIVSMGEEKYGVERSKTLADIIEDLMDVSEGGYTPSYEPI